MKKSIFFLAAIMALSTGCYDDYVKDFDKSAVFVAYQYDLRTFVLDEGEQFKFTVGLGGVMQNDQDRSVALAVDPSLLDGAIANLKNIEKVSGDYVVEFISASGISKVEELPQSYYTIEGLDGLTIRKGKHTASVTLKATELMRNDPKVFSANYAVGFRVLKADADLVAPGKDYAVIAVKCENRFYGYWSHSCKIEEKDPAGNVVSTRYIPFSSTDGNAYTLTTVNGESLVCNRVAGETRDMLLTFAGDDITIVSADGVSGTGRFNGDKLLQNRKLYLDYSYLNAAGNTVTVTDTLSFRNRIRDGVNEWQDENPENYK